MTVAVPRALADVALPARAFTVETGNIDHPVQAATPVRDLQVVLLLDTSMTMRRLRTAQSAAVEMILLLPPRTGVAVLGFDSRPRLATAMIRDLRAKLAWVGNLRPGGGRALYDAVIAGLDQFPARRRGSRAVLLLTAGADTSSHTSPQQAYRQRSASGATFYGIELGGAALARLAGKVGGQVITVSHPDDLVGVYDRIADELVRQHRLRFGMKAGGGSALRVRVRHGGATVRTAETVVSPGRRNSGQNSAQNSDRLTATTLLVSLLIVAVCARLLRVFIARRRDDGGRAASEGKIIRVSGAWDGRRRGRWRRPGSTPAILPPSPGRARAPRGVIGKIVYPTSWWLPNRRRPRSESVDTVETVRSAFTHIPRVKPYLRPYRALLVVAALLTLLAALVTLALPWPLAFLVDSALGDRQAPELLGRLIGPSPSRRILFAVGAGLVLTLVANGISIVNSYVQTRLEQRMILDVRSDLFEHVQRLSLAFHDKQRKGMLMFAINYQAASVGEITSVLLPLVENVVTIAGMAYIAYRLDPRLALLSLTIVPGIFFSTRFYTGHVEPRLRHVREKEGTSLSIVHEAMSMLRVIIAFGRERHEHRRFRTQGREAVDARIDVTVRQTAFSLGVNVITAVGTAIVIGYGAHLVLRGSLSVGQLLVMLAYIAAVYQPMEAISGTAASLQEQLISLEAAVRLLDTEPEVKDPEHGIVLHRAEGRVIFDHVSFNYQGRVGTLKDITFEAHADEVVAIVGPTGAGKSTLVSLIPRFFDPQRGRVMLDGVDVRDITLESLRAQISIVLQEPLLFSGTIADNIRYGWLDASADEVIQAAMAANAHDFIAGLPEQYDTVLGERGAQLSGGERQRISIARAFLKDASILVLDEPTSSVDSQTDAVILDALRRLVVGRTTFMIAHRLSTIRNADRILVMNHGRIVQQGTHDELLVGDGLFREMWEAQSGRPASAGGMA